MIKTQCCRSWCWFYSRIFFSTRSQSEAQAALEFMAVLPSHPSGCWALRYEPLWLTFRVQMNKHFQIYVLALLPAIHAANEKFWSNHQKVALHSGTYYSSASNWNISALTCSICFWIVSDLVTSAIKSSPNYYFHS